VLCVYYLCYLRKKSPFEDIDLLGYNLVHIICTIHNIESLNLLRIRGGYDITLKSKQGEDPLMIALKTKAPQNFISELLLLGAVVDESHIQCVNKFKFDSNYQDWANSVNKILNNCDKSIFVLCYVKSIPLSTFKEKVNEQFPHLIIALNNAHKVLLPEENVITLSDK